MTQKNRPNSRRSLQQNLFFLLENSCKSSRQLTQIHGQITINGFSQKSFILVKLLSLYTVFKSFQHAHQLFEKVECPINVKFWDQIIKSHSVEGNWRRSIELFNAMCHSLALPGAYTYNYVINSCTKGGLFGEGEQIHGKILKCGFCSNVHVGSTLVDFYAKCGRVNGIKKAKQVFDEMPEKNVVVWNSLVSGCFRLGDVDQAKNIFEEMPERNMISWTTMISGCVQNGMYKKALTLFSNMRDENVEFDNVTLLAVLSACAELGDLNTGKWIHSFIDESFICRKFQVPIKVNNALIHMYASCGEIDKALIVFKGMVQRTTVSWTSMITGFAKQGYANESLSMFKCMIEQNDAHPDEITLLGVLSACSHSGLVDEGRYYFASMTKNWGIKPNIEHFGCMVDLFSRAGLLNEAHELIKSMPMKPNDVVWGALLGGCRIYKNVDIASDVADWLTKELDPDKTAGYFVLLSNVYAASKRWQDVVKTRRKIVDTKTNKSPGQSWIQIDAVMHEFIAGDRSHENVHLIYEILDGVTREARLQGYIPYFTNVAGNFKDGVICFDE